MLLLIDPKNNACKLEYLNKEPKYLHLLDWRTLSGKVSSRKDDSWPFPIWKLTLALIPAVWEEEGETLISLCALWKLYLFKIETDKSLYKFKEMYYSQECHSCLIIWWIRHQMKLNGEDFKSFGSDSGLSLWYLQD